MEPKYKRVLLKLSGEAIARKNDDGTVSEIFDDVLIDGIVGSIRKLLEQGIQVAVVIGAGNIWRGKYGKNMRRARADHMGMLGTVMNCLKFEDSLERAGIPARVLSPIQMNSFTEQYDFRRAEEYLENGKVVLLGCGTGMPYVTTDTAVVVRAAEISADVILMAKNIDGVYERDPRDSRGNIDPSVKRYRKISYQESLERDLKATDAYATMLAKEQKIDMYIFALSDPDNVYKAACGENIGTLVSSENIESETY